MNQNVIKSFNARDSQVAATAYIAYEGRAKIYVTNRLPWFYPRYILKCFNEWCVE